MPTVNDIIIEIEKIADPKYAYEWDNCGLCAGDKKSIVKKVLITLDITKDVVIEAINKGCQMIISHHPLIFKPVLTVNTDTYAGEVLSLLYKNNIALYCAHTSLDIAVNGVNEALCKKLQLKNVSLLAPFIIDGTKLYILSNKAGVNGATSMIFEDIIKAFAVEHSTDVYILPSSIHEVLLLPHEEGMDKKEMEEMVREINTYVVSQMEYLSDNVYKYDFKEFCVKI